MTLPHIFATQPAGNVPASYLDVDFTAVLAGTAGPFTQAEIDFTKAISGPAAANNTALYMTGTISGTTSDFNWGYQQIFMAESLDNTGAGAGATVNGLMVNHAGYAGVGARNGVLGVYSHNAATTNTTQAFYTAVFANTIVSHDDGGGSGTEKGDFYGFGSITQVAAAGTHLHGVIGAEFSTAMAAGSSTREKIGLQVTTVNSDAVKGSVADAAILIAGDGTITAGLDFGIVFGKPGAKWNIDGSRGTLIGTYTTTNSMTAVNGIDFSAATFSGDAFKSNAFFVDGNGNLECNSLTGDAFVSSGNFLTAINANAFVSMMQVNGGQGWRWTLNNDTTLRLQHTTNGFGAGTTIPMLFDASDNANIAQSITAYFGTAVGAGSAAQSFIKGSTTANLGVFYGTGVPSFSAAQGSIYTNTTASVATARAFVNTNGSTGWAFFTASA